MTRAEMEAQQAEFLRSMADASGGVAVADEPRPMRKGAYNIEESDPNAVRDMSADMLLMQKSADVPPDMKKSHEALADLNDGALFIAAILKKSVKEATEMDWYRSRVESLRKSDSRIKKSLDTATAGDGAEWAPTRPSGDFFSIYSAALTVAPLFTPTIKMPSGVIQFPTMSARPVLVAGSEKTTDQQAKVTEVNPTTANRSFTAKKIVGRIVYSNEMEADAIFPWIPKIRAELAVALARAEDSAYLDGDTTNPHQDNDIAAGGTDVRTLFRGLRKHALANGLTVDMLGTAAGFTAGRLRQLRSLMGDYSLAGTNDLVYIAGQKVSTIRMLSLGNDIKPPGSHPLGLEYNTRVPGEVGRFDGYRVIGSVVARETLNAVGVHDLTTQNTGYVLCVHLPSWIKGVRQEATFRVFDDVIYEQGHLVISYRGAFDTMFTAEPTCAIAYNCLTTA